MSYYKMIIFCTNLYKFYIDYFIPLNVSLKNMGLSKKRRLSPFKQYEKFYESCASVFLKW
jgi:hypothetical protein